MIFQRDVSPGERSNISERNGEKLIINSHSVKNFRNIDSASVTLDPEMNIFYGENGYIININDYNAMAQRICGILEDDVLYERLSKKAIELIKPFSKEKI